MMGRFHGESSNGGDGTGDGGGVDSGDPLNTVSISFTLRFFIELSSSSTVALSEAWRDGIGASAFAQLACA